MKIAFITGGATGIGRATVDRFIKEGISVGLFDRNESAAEDALREHGEDKLLTITGDVTNRDDVRRGVASTVERFAGLDIVFTCAGIHRNNSILDIEEDEWNAVLDINLRGTFYTLGETAPVLVERGGGAIILMGSDQCFIGKPSSLAYGASKGAIGQMAKSLAIDLGPRNIRVNAICPGTTRTPLAESAFNRAAEAMNRDVEELWEMETARYPLGRVGAPDDIADVVYFLASDDARWVTGALYAVDGGLVAG